MYRTLIAAGLTTAALTLAAPSQAAPALCAEHPARYITACAGGGGGGGQDDFYRLYDALKAQNGNPLHPNYGKFNNLPDIDR